MAYKASDTIAVKRLRTGQTIYLSLNTSGGALFQTVDDTGAASPDWTVAANRPVVTPSAATGTGAADIQNGQWYYNSTPLYFTGGTEGDYVIDSSGKFGQNPENWALTIVENLATSTNYSNDTLEFRCTVYVDDVPYEMSKSIAITIMKASASSYYGSLAGDNALYEGHTSTTLTGTLFSGGSQMSAFYAKMFVNDTNTPYSKDSEMHEASNSEVTWDVDIDYVDGNTLFLAAFYLDEDGTQPVAVAGMQVVDATDPYQLRLTIEGDNQELSDKTPVTVVARLVRGTDGATGYLMDSCSLVILDEQLQPIESSRKTETSCTEAKIDVTTDYSANNNDVVVQGEAEYTI